MHGREHIPTPARSSTPATTWGSWTARCWRSSHRSPSMPSPRWRCSPDGWAGSCGGAGQVPLDRFNPDPAAVKACLRVLRDGHAVGIFPEGRRGTGDLERFHRGAAYFALVTGAPVVPVIFLGTREPGGHTDSVPARGSAVDVVSGRRSPSTRVPWPRSREQVEQVSVRLREHLLALLERAPRRDRARPAGPAARRTRSSPTRPPGSPSGTLRERRQPRPGSAAGRPGPGARRGGPPQRGQVDAGQPLPRPPGGGRGGRPRRHPGPGVVRRQLERPRVHRRGHRRLGPGRARAGRADRRPGRDRREPGRRGALRRGRDGRHHRRRRGGREDPAAVREAGRPGRQQGRRPAHRDRGARAVEPRAGGAVPGLGAARTRLGRPAGRRTRRAAGPAARAAGARSAARAGSRSSGSRTSASPHCSTSWPGRTGSSSTTSPGPPSTRWTS